MEAIAAEALRTLSECPFEVLAMIAWSFASISKIHLPLMTALSAASMAIIAEAQAHSLGNLAWSMAALEVSDRTWLNAIAAQSRRQIKQHSTALTGLVWALATMNVTHRPLLDALAEAALDKIHQLSSQFISNMAWSCAVLEYHHRPLFDAIASSARNLLSLHAQDLGRFARAFWVLTYDHRLWGPLLMDNLARMEEDDVLGTLDRIPRKFGVSKEALRDRSLLPEGYEATTNWWKSSQVVGRSRSAIEVPGVTDRRLIGVLSEMQKIGGEAAYGFIHCPEIKSQFGCEVFVKNCNVNDFKAGSAVSFRVIFKKERKPEAVEVGEPSEASPGDPSMIVCVDTQELAKKGYVMRTTRSPESGAVAAQSGDIVCVSYVGRLASDRTVFDAANNVRFVLGAGSVIRGWETGIAEMKVGQEVRLIVHHSHAYGETGAPTPEPVPPFANLDFSLTLLDVAKPDGPVELSADDGAFTLLTGASESLPDEAGVAFVNGSEAEVVSSKECERPRSGADAAQPKRGRRWRSLMIEAMNYSVKSWLLSMDKQGSLLEFHDKLQREYRSVHDIVSVYTKVGFDGSTTIEPEFFEVVGVTKAASKRLFQTWFESAA